MPVGELLPQLLAAGSLDSMGDLFTEELMSLLLENTSAMVEIGDDDLHDIQHPLTLSFESGKLVAVELFDPERQFDPGLVSLPEGWGASHSKKFLTLSVRDR